MGSDRRICNACGKVIDVGLSERVRCPRCGYVDHPEYMALASASTGEAQDA